MKLAKLTTVQPDTFGWEKLKLATAITTTKMTTYM